MLDDKVIYVYLTFNKVTLLVFIGLFHVFKVRRHNNDRFL